MEYKLFKSTKLEIQPNYSDASAAEENYIYLNQKGNKEFKLELTIRLSHNSKKIMVTADRTFF